MRLPLLLLLGLTIHVIAQDAPPIITTTGGQVQGTTESCGLFCSYYSFKGIPYAESPIGALRFRPTVPHGGWTGIRNAGVHGSTCPTDEYLPGESEDCLFLNVYSSSLVGATRPVMVFIHGGAFSTGSGNDDLYGASFLMVEDVVVVTINYRLGILGFLSTGDRYAQGNWGLKDCIEALRWVQSNVASFGGDPNNVTLFGHSAGAAMTHLLALSTLTAGLFQRVILQSGAALTAWGVQPNPRFYANRVASAFGLSTTDTQAMIEGLRGVPYQQLISLQEGFFGAPIPRFFRSYDFAPVVESADSQDPMVIDRHPIDIIETGAYRSIPMMIGSTDAEALFSLVLETAADPTVFDTFNANPHYFVPIFWNIQQGTAGSTAVSDGFKQFYLQNQPLSPSLFEQFGEYQTDHQFTYSAVETAKRHATRNSVYFYHFSYDGDLNLMKRSIGVPFPGAVHGDEVSYVFDSPGLRTEEILPTSHAYTVRDRMVRLWTNFARYSNPTPTADATLQGISWPAITSGSINVVLNVGQNLLVGANPTGTRMNLWDDLAQRYGSNLFRH